MTPQNEQTIAEILRKPYSRVLVPEEDGQYSAALLEFPGCVSQGGTPEEAYRNLEDAAFDWVAAAIEDGARVPDPLDRNTAGGRLLVRLPRTLHGQLQRIAAREKVSVNQLAVTALASYVGGANVLATVASRLPCLGTGAISYTTTPGAAVVINATTGPTISPMPPAAGATTAPIWKM